MVNTLFLHSLLDSDKLTRPNFDSWYQKLKIILKHERILYILTDEAPEELTANAPHAARDSYMKWLNDRMTVHYMMRAAMNDELSRKFKDAQSEEIIQILNESFSTPNVIAQNLIQPTKAQNKKIKKKNRGIQNREEDSR